MKEDIIINLLKKVDWDFKDYSIASSPNDINYLHWYPAPFVPQIPSIMVQTLSKIGDKVLDPFVGSGVTLVEAAKQRRSYLGVDSNPFAIDISKAKFLAIDGATKTWFKELKEIVLKNKITKSTKDYCEHFNIDSEVHNWFAQETLTELLSIWDCIIRRRNNLFLLEKVLFSSILTRVCSQRNHYTYITDRCFPKKFIPIPAKKVFIEQSEIIAGAARLFREQYRRMHGQEWGNMRGKIELGDARSLDWIGNKEVDLIVTSPPYLGVHDYVKSTRLTNLFFPQSPFKELVENEIGSRSKRKRKSAFDDYIKKTKECFAECKRVLRPGGYLGLVIGQGRGKVVKSNIVQLLNDYLERDLKFKILFRAERKIMFRRIQMPGHSFEFVEVLKRT